MMKLNLITFASSLASRESIFTDHHELLDAIKEKYDVRYIFPEELDKTAIEDATTMVLVGSGGVEEMVKADIDRLPPYVVLIADGLKNSKSCRGCVLTVAKGACCTAPPVSSCRASMTMPKPVAPSRSSTASAWALSANLQGGSSPATWTMQP